jgi:MFS superfamily sulfate permease-like transporter
MNKLRQPSSTITATAVAGFIAATMLLIVKIMWPDIYAQIPETYRSHLVVAIAVVIGYFKRENVLPLKDEDR